jgi:hypothetical protein
MLAKKRFEKARDKDRDSNIDRKREEGKVRMEEGR